MSKKLPEGYSVKTIVEEKGFIDMYRWTILKNGKVLRDSYALTDCRVEAREDGLEFLFKNYERLENMAKGD